MNTVASLPAKLLALSDEVAALPAMSLTGSSVILPVPRAAEMVTTMRKAAAALRLYTTPPTPSAPDRYRPALQKCHDALLKFSQGAFGTPPWADLTAALEAAQDALSGVSAPVGVDALNASIVREAADLLTAVSDSGVQLPETWRWPLIDELRGIAALAGKDSDHD